MARKKNAKFNRARKYDGRATDLNEETIQKICNTLRLGAYVETAVALADVPKENFYAWVRRGNPGNPLYKRGSIYEKLLLAVERAKEEATARDLLVIDNAANGQKPEYERDHEGKLVLDGDGNPIVIKRGFPPNWNAAAWRLERRKPREWGKLERIEHTGHNGGSISVEDRSTEDLEKEFKRLVSLLDDNKFNKTE